MSWEEFYENIVLTEEELKEAIREGKRKKYFREKNADYWRELEEKKIKPRLK
jgi:hypothetical protein